MEHRLSNYTPVIILHNLIFKTFLNLSLDILRIISLATEHLKINLRKS